MESLLQEKIPSLLEKQDIVADDMEVISKELAYHIYTMIFNVCALIATHTLIHDKENRKVVPEHIKESVSYVMKKCYPGKKKEQTGGDAYGYDALYQEMRNAEIAKHLKFGGGISVFTIIFTKVLPDKSLFPTEFIKKLFEHFEVVINDNGIKNVKHILKMIVSCLLSDLKKAGDKVTPTVLHKVMKLKRHSVFL